MKMRSTPASAAIFATRRVVGDVHKIQHMFSSNCRAGIDVILVAQNLKNGHEKDLNIQHKRNVLRIPDVHFNALVPLHTLAAMYLAPNR